MKEFHRLKKQLQELENKKSSGIFCKGNKVEIYQFILANKEVFKMQCLSSCLLQFLETAQGKNTRPNNGEVHLLVRRKKHLYQKSSPHKKEILRLKANIEHSEQGSQFTSREFTSFSVGVIQSMSGLPDG